MTQDSDGVRREADLFGVTTSLPSALPPPQMPDEFTQAVHFVGLTIALYILYIICTAVAYNALRDAGFYAWFYGPQIVADAFTPNSTSHDMQTRLQLWAIAAAFPCWLIPTAFVCYFLPSSYRSDIGVSLGRFARLAFGKNLLLGFAAWSVLAPAALGANLLVEWLYQRFVAIKPEEHPLTVAAQSGQLLPVEWALLAFGVMVSAPLWEELLFRGLLPALCRKLGGRGGHAAMTLAFAAALLLRRQQIADTWHQGATPLLLAAMPVLFIVAMLPLYAVVCWRSRTENGPIVFGTALLFGAVHSFAWPTPVALFILGLGLGWLACWTRSLVAPVLVHGLFNAVSFGLLYFG